MSKRNASRTAKKPRLNLTDHARWRAAQRNLSRSDLLYCLGHASEVHRDGDCFRVLRRRDIPLEDQLDNEIARLDGTVLVIATDGWIKTVYRDPMATRKIRRKPEDSWGFRPHR